jgi:hypothetical protein
VGDAGGHDGSEAVDLVAHLLTDPPLRPNRSPTVAQLRRLPQGLMSNFEISAQHTTLEQSSGGDLLIVPTLRVGMPSGTLCVQNDAERHALRYHAERGNDHVATKPCSPACRRWRI